MEKQKVERAPTVISSKVGHALFHADSQECQFASVFSLLLTSPPYYHPVRASAQHGVGFTGDLAQYADTVADVLVHCSKAVIHRSICLVKTDVWYRNTLIPVGYEIANACVGRGLTLRAHWIWQRLPAYSPYGTSFANVFVLGDEFSRPHFSGIISGVTSKRKKGLPSSFVPEVFGALIQLLTRRGDTVLDPFAGVGGVIEAAATQDRRSVGIELSGIQVRQAVRRLHRIPGFIVKYPGSRSAARRRSTDD